MSPNKALECVRYAHRTAALLRGRSTLSLGVKRGEPSLSVT